MNRLFEQVFFLILLLGFLGHFASTSDDFYFISPSDENEVTIKTVLEGEPVTIECSVSDVNFIQFSWSTEEKPVVNTTRRYQNGPNLHINRVLHQYDGERFYCEATNSSSGFTLTSNPVQLNIIWITSKASVSLSAPDKLDLIRPGVDIVLKCRIDGTSEITFDWFRNGERIHYTHRIYTRTKRLHINNITTGDSGSYSCRARNGAGIAEVDGSFNVIVHDPRLPRVISPPTDQIVNKNGNAQLDCQFEGLPTIHWYFGNKGPLTNSSRYTVHKNGSLNIRWVDESDEGIYKCGNFNAYPIKVEESQIFSAILRVAYLRELTQDSFLPAPVYPGHKLALPESSNLEIFCAKPEGIPTPRRWFEDQHGKIVPDSGDRVFVQDSNTLIIKNIQEASDKGNWSCLASNSRGQFTRTYFDLVVTTPPNIFGHPLSSLVQEGEMAVFMCQYRGPKHPVTTVQWLKGKTPISDDSNFDSNSGDPEEIEGRKRIVSFGQNGTLLINSVQLSDGGDYSCEIKTPGFPSTRSRPAQLFVQETLKFNPNPINRKLQLGSAAKIHCRTNTNAVVKWMKYGLPLPKAFEFPEHISDINGTLTFKTVHYSDASKYTCVATNSQGFINITIDVDVIVTPKFIIRPTNPTEATEGQSLLIPCSATGTPQPKINWDRNGKMLDGYENSRFQVLINGSLYISEVHLEDTGFLGCTAGSSAGLKREEIRLIVQSNDQNISHAFDDSNVMTRTVSITLTISASYILLVIGLMLWCRFRQFRRKQNYLEEMGKTGDTELKEVVPNGNGTLLVSNGHTLKAVESCRESIKSDGEANKSQSSNGYGKIASATASVTSQRSQISKKSTLSGGYDKISLSRQDLQFVMLLGNGEFGEVFLAKAKNISKKESGESGESLVMVKALQTHEESSLFEFKREIDMYFKLNHENVSRLLKLCREMDPQYLIMEYSDWGDLKQFLLCTRKDNPRKIAKPPQLTIIQVIQVVSQIALGMEHLSNHRFVHKDLATRNCLISSGLRIQVSNPGLCRDTYSNEYMKYRNQIIPVRWLPHEAVIEDDFSTKSDIYSFGVLIWEVLQQASIPFPGLSNSDVLESLEKKEMSWIVEIEKIEQIIPSSLCSLMEKCLDPCPRNRPSFSQVVVELDDISKTLV